MEAETNELKLVPEGNDSEDECVSNPKVEGVDVFESNLTGEKDKLIQVRFRMCKGKPEEWVSLRLAVLGELPAPPAAPRSGPHRGSRRSWRR